MIRGKALKSVNGESISSEFYLLVDDYPRNAPIIPKKSKLFIIL
jgi:hypothetical protein